MHWLKDVTVDILVTLFIAVAIWLGEVWLWWVIAVYTLLMIIAKSVVLWGDGFLSRAQKSQNAPEWFLHLLYGINVALLAYAGWWYLLGGWVVIWILSFLGQRKINQ